MAVGLCLYLAVISQPGHVIFASFDEGLRADRNDWAALEPVVATGFRLSAAGEGCPTNPGGRALDAGFSPDIYRGSFALPLPEDADLRQGTVELWFRPAWPAGTRDVFALFNIKLRGGYWNGLWLGYHGTIGADAEALGSNIMDGLDHPAYLCPSRHLGWRAGEWHHLAWTWTDQTSYVFWDGKLIAQVISSVPFRTHNNEGQVCLGGGFRSDTPARVMIDEFRFCDVPLYCPDAPPDPMRRIGGDLPLGIATLSVGAKAVADSTAAPQPLNEDVPELHDGVYGPAVQVGLQSGLGTVTVRLAEEADVAGFEWSRDGVPYAGPEGRGWAHVLPYPLEYSIETSLDGKTWEKALEEPNFRITPSFVASHEALRFRHDFPARRARYVRMDIRRGPRGDWQMVLDEVAVYAPDGRNLAREPGAQVFTEITSRAWEYDARLAIDGRWGNASAWRSAVPGQGTLTVELPATATISSVVFSRSREGLASDGVPSAGRLELSLDGEHWAAVAEITGTDAKPREVRLDPQQARFVRLVITATADGKEPIIDDLRVY
ncbi:MAG: discoidin domain-containing protein [Armatimonadetes bacterium]|nr:discoidin domain-containing protein [Armatimonadota bacterium]